MLCRESLLPHQTFRSKVHWRLQNHQEFGRSKLSRSQNKCSFSEEGKVCINNEINHVVSCINFVTIAEPINCHISRCHGVKHKILKVGQGLSWEKVCFVHDGIIADFGGNLNPYCATLPTGFFSLLFSSNSIDKVWTNLITEVINIFHDFIAIVVNNLCSLKCQLTQKNYKCNNMNCSRFEMWMKITTIEFPESITKLESLLCHVTHEIQAPKDCWNSEDLRTKCINACAPESDSFKHLDCRDNVKEIDCGHDEKNCVGS